MPTPHGPGPLGEFLRSRRSRLSPRDRGLPAADGRRRVPGLRREELALLAGVSATYYARLEQGTSQHASPAVLDAIARALDLDESERRHLHDLAALRRRTRLGGPAAERLDPGLADLLPALDGVPALVLGRRLDVLAWNPLGHALVAGHLDARCVDRPADAPNSAAMVFLDPRTRELYADWPRKARAVVGHLRMVAGRSADDPQLTSLVDELTTTSPDFARLWSDHAVGLCEGSTYDLDHPLVGALTVTQQTLQPVGVQDQSLVTFTITNRTGSARAQQLLDQLTATAASALSGSR